MPDTEGVPLIDERPVRLGAVLTYPVCLAGKRHCPPEDCGGAWGYEDLLKAVRDPDHERHDELLVWAGEDFDPEEFSVDVCVGERAVGDCA